MKYCVAHILGKRWAKLMPVLNLILGYNDGVTEKAFCGFSDDQMSQETTARKCALDNRLLLTRLPPFNLERLPTLEMLASSSAQVLVLDDSYLTVDADEAMVSLAAHANMIRAALLHWKASVLITEKIHKHDKPMVAAALGVLDPSIVKTLNARGLRKKRA